MILLLLHAAVVVVAVVVAVFVVVAKNKLPVKYFLKIFKTTFCRFFYTDND